MSDEFNRLNVEQRIGIERDAIMLFNNPLDNNDKLCLSQIHNIKRNKKIGAYAPHKAVLLLAVLELMEEGIITSNRIELNEELKKRFVSIWSKHVPRSCIFKSDIKSPFKHLDAEPFWTTHNSKCATLYDAMYKAFNDNQSKEQIRRSLLEMIVTQSTSKLVSDNQIILLSIFAPTTSSILTLYA